MLLEEPLGELIVGLEADFQIFTKLPAEYKSDVDAVVIVVVLLVIAVLQIKLYVVPILAVVAEGRVTAVPAALSKRTVLPD